MTNQQLWQAVLAELELSLSKANFTTWFKGTFIAEVAADGRVTIGVPNNFTKSWLEGKFQKEILKSLRRLGGETIREAFFQVIAAPTGSALAAGVRLSEDHSAAAPSPAAPAVDGQPAAPAPARRADSPAARSGFNQHYTFDTFIVGKANELAHAACQAAAANPGQTYNPVFIYGGAGLGKTHLLQAVGQDLLRQHPDWKVLYTTCERFTNEFVQSIKNGTNEEFRRAHRNIDALLVDDVQFMAGKDGTQEEFFHTFNALHGASKQIVLTSDRPPKAIPALEERLTTRFGQGMIGDIGQPDQETRMAILQAKCREKRYQLDPAVIEYVASAIQTNIRELEGALNRLIANQQLTKEVPTVESAQQLLGSLIAQQPRGGLTAKKIIQAAADYFDIKVEDIVGNSRKKELVNPRQIVMYLMREELRASYPNIGDELGGRDHTTAIHAYTKIAEEISHDAKLRHDIELLRQRLYAAAA